MSLAARIASAAKVKTKRRLVKREPKTDTRCLMPSGLIVDKMEGGIDASGHLVGENISDCAVDERMNGRLNWLARVEVGRDPSVTVGNRGVREICRGTKVRSKCQRKNRVRETCESTRRLKY